MTVVGVLSYKVLSSGIQSCGKKNWDNSRWRLRSVKDWDTGRRTPTRFLRYTKKSTKNGNEKWNLLAWKSQSVSALSPQLYYCRAPFTGVISLSKCVSFLAGKNLQNRGQTYRSLESLIV